MKFVISSIICVLVALSAYSQTEVTKFLGIPVDGSKKEMIRSLKKKGFRPSNKEKGVLIGTFNGSTVSVHILETKGKVDRIAVIPLYGSSASDVIIKFNNLCSQFLNKDNYVALLGDILMPTYEDLAISSPVDIDYEMKVNDKRFEASFIQLPSSRDSILEEIKSYKTGVITMSDENGKKIDLTSYLELITKYSNNSVWFKIEEQSGKFFIILFYDNRSNQANGEDL